MSVFTLAHISDLHWPNSKIPELGDIFNKRLLGAYNWQFNRKKYHTIEMLNALVQDLEGQCTMHSLISGDLTNLSLPNELDEVYQWVTTHFLPTKSTIISGNHDAYVKNTLQPFTKKFTEYMGGQSHFPFLRRFGNISLIGLNSAHPTLPFRAVGWLGNSQIQQLRDILIQEHELGQCRIIAIHHPPAHVICPHNKRLVDADILQNVLINFGFEFLLYGHLHEFAHSTLNTLTGVGHCLSVPSASDTLIQGNRGSGYSILHIQKSNLKWQACVNFRRIGQIFQELNLIV